MELEEHFENEHLDARQLPQLELGNFVPLQREYLYLRLTLWGLFFFLALAVLIVLYFTADIPLFLSLGTFMGVLLIVLIKELLGFKIKGYALREHDISYKSGLLFFKLTTVPLNRIQHCEVSQGPLGRLFDLASVNVYTAGGSMSDLSISGLEKDQAHKLREHITKLAATYA